MVKSGPSLKASLIKLLHVWYKNRAGNECNLTTSPNQIGNGDTKMADAHTLPNPKFYIDGRTHARAYETWKAMMKRCSNPKQQSYKYYGGRGIYVVPAWRDINVFLGWAGDHPLPGETIDRKNTDGPYSPENCRWSAIAEQNRNKRSNVPLTFNGKTQIIADWAKELNLPVSTIWKRLNRSKRSIHDALSIQKYHRPKSS